jgi:hypothetical protein
MLIIFILWFVTNSVGAMIHGYVGVYIIYGVYI